MTRTILTLLSVAACACAARTPAPPPDIAVAVTVDDLPGDGPLPPGVTREYLEEQMLAGFARHRMPPVWLDDAWRNEPLLQRLDPRGNWKVFRYPYLFEGDQPHKKSTARRALQERGYTIAEVTIDAEDWAYTPAYARCLAQGNGAAADELRRGFVRAHVDELRYVQKLTRLLEGREVAHVLLLHLIAIDADRLDALLTAYEAEGVRWVDLVTALADPMYARDPGVAVPWGAAFPYVLAKGRGVKLPPRPATDQERLVKLCPEPAR